MKTNSPIHGSNSNNRARSKKRFFNRSPAPATLQVSLPGDGCEQEADSISDKMMQTPGGEKGATFFQPAPIQAKPSTSAQAPLVTSSVSQTLNSAGQPMDDTTRSFMESRFGHDFENVRIHNDRQAHQSSEEIYALAYTHGNHIFFGNGQYQPNTNAGKKILAHELVHVVQHDNAGTNHLVSRKVNFDSKSRIDSIQFTVGVEISEAFCKLVQSELKKGKLDDSKVEILLKHLIQNNGTVSDSDRIFIASLYNQAFSSKIKKDQIAAGNSYSIKLKNIQIGKLNYISSFGRVAAGRGSIKEEAPSDALDPNDRSAVLNVLSVITSINPYDPLIEDLAHGRLKIDSLSDTQISKISGNPDFAAFYSPVASLTGLKGKTLYIPSNINWNSLYDRSLLIHELQHARDDLNAGTAITSMDKAQLELKSYVTQAQYIIDTMLSTSDPAQLDAYAKNVSVKNALVFLGFIYVGLGDKQKYRAVLDKIWQFAPTDISKIPIDRFFRFSKAHFESLFIIEIQAAYKLQPGDKTTMGGGTDAESIIKWHPKLP